MRAGIWNQEMEVVPGPYSGVRVESDLVVGFGWDLGGVVRSPRGSLRACHFSSEEEETQFAFFIPVATFDRGVPGS